MLLPSTPATCGLGVTYSIWGFFSFFFFLATFQRVSSHCFCHPGAREESSMQQAQRRSAVFLSFKSPIPCLPLRWEQQSKLLPTVAGIPASKVSKWSTDEVGFTFFVCPGTWRRSTGLRSGQHECVRGLVFFSKREEIILRETMKTQVGYLEPVPMRLWLLFQNWNFDLIF